MTIKNERHLMAPCVGIMALNFASASLGATSGPAAEGATGLEEIVVTAQRREENLQKVPISVTALTAAALQTAGVGSTVELLNVTPGFVYSRQIKGGVPFIRAVGTPDSSVYNEPAVATYVDGVYIMDATATIFALNNIKSIEVLKGPQGTLFGRNATGGLINVRTRDPQTEFAAEASLGYGNYGTADGALYLTGGAGSVAADLAVYAVHQSEGFGEQLDVGGDVNRRRETTLRSKILWTASDDDRVIVTLDWTDNKSDLGMVRNVLPGSRLFGGVPFRGEIYDNTGTIRPEVPRSRAWGASVKYEHAFEAATLSLLSAYRSNDLIFTYDQDLTLTRLADVLADTDSNTLQNELLLVGDSGRLKWTTGIFLFSGSAAYYPLSIRSISPASNTDLFATAKLRSYAGFAEGTYAVSEGTRITAGLRHTSDEREMDGRRLAAIGNASAAGTVLQTRSEEKTFSKLTWRLSLDHAFGDDVLGYLSYTRGFKSGVYNITDLASPVVDPETIDAYEVGVKSEFFNRTLRLNAAAFHYKYDDIQLTRVLAGFNQLFNAAAGEINGAEIETAWAVAAPGGDLQLNAGFSYLADAKYTSFPNGPRSSPVPAPGGGNVTATADLTGNRMIRAPKWTLNLGADYRIPLASGELGFSASYYRNDGFAWDPDNRLQQAPYDVVNAHIAYAFGEDNRYRVRAWGKNLGDEQYYVYVTASGLGDLAGPASPRTYGVSVDFQF